MSLVFWLSNHIYCCCPVDLLSSLADCTWARIWVPGRCGVFDTVLDHLQWLLHEQANKRNPALTILWNRRGSQGKHTHTHRGCTIFAPLLFWRVPPIDCITMHFMLQGRRKQRVSSTLCSEAGMFLSRIRWKGNIWEPTQRINNNTAVIKLLSSCIKGSWPFLTALAKLRKVLLGWVSWHIHVPALCLHCQQHFILPQGSWLSIAAPAGESAAARLQTGEDTPACCSRGLGGDRHCETS